MGKKAEAPTLSRIRYMPCFDLTHAPVETTARAAATGPVCMSTRPDPEGSDTVETCGYESLAEFTEGAGTGMKVLQNSHKFRAREWKLQVLQTSHKFWAREWKSYRTHKSSGYGNGRLTELTVTKFRVGI